MKAERLNPFKKFCCSHWFCLPKKIMLRILFCLSVLKPMIKIRKIMLTISFRIDLCFIYPVFQFIFELHFWHGMQLLDLKRCITTEYTHFSSNTWSFNCRFYLLLQKFEKKLALESPDAVQYQRIWSTYLLRFIFISLVFEATLNADFNILRSFCFESWPFRPSKSTQVEVRARNCLWSDRPRQVWPLIRPSQAKITSDQTSVRSKIIVRSKCARSRLWPLIRQFPDQCPDEIQTIVQTKVRSNCCPRPYAWIISADLQKRKYCTNIHGNI